MAHTKERRRRLVQWGAGNIGRSFIGQVFALGGCEVVFIDIDRKLVEALSEAGAYQVIEVSAEGEKVKTIEGISAISPDMHQELLEAIGGADYLSFSVGKNILPRLIPQAVEAIVYRHSLRPEDPLDIIIAENISNGAEVLRSLFASHLPGDFPIESYLGFVETSLGKMVPLQSGTDPLKVWAEPFNTLILDRKGFLGPLPDYADVRLVEPIEAYVAEKLYIHNLGHATAAYLGNLHNPRFQYIWEAMESSEVRRKVRQAMEQAGAVLRARFPGVFTQEEIESHIDDLLFRFANRALGDTIFRVGRDLSRKLHKEDRLMGAIILASRFNLPWDAIGKAYKAAFSFQTADGDGKPFPQDQQFLSGLEGLDGPGRIIRAAGFDQREAAEYYDAIISPLAGM
jgi:mannitol-1-phosphate 5-dehydrogenase